MKKKIITLLLASALSLGLFACGKENTKSNIETTTQSTTEERDDGTFQAERGSVENNLYKNNQFDISFSIDEDCEILTDQKIAETLGYADKISTAMTGNLTADTLENAFYGTFYDVWFVYPDQQTNVYIAYENMKKTGTYGSLTAADYAKMLKESLSKNTSVYYTFSDDTHVSYCGYEYICLNSKLNDGAGLQKMLIRQVGNYMMCITVSYSPSNTEICSEFLDSIKNAN